MPIMGPASLLDPAINYSLASSDLTASYLHVPLRVCPLANARISDVHRPLNVMGYRGMNAVLEYESMIIFHSINLSNNTILLFNIQ